MRTLEMLSGFACLRAGAAAGGRGEQVAQQRGDGGRAWAGAVGRHAAPARGAVRAACSGTPAAPPACLQGHGRPWWQLLLLGCSSLAQCTSS